MESKEIKLGKDSINIFKKRISLLVGEKLKMRDDAKRAASM